MPPARVAVAAFALFALTACGPDATPANKTGLLASPSASASPSPSESPSSSSAPPAVATPTIAPPAVPTTASAPTTKPAAPKTTKPAPPKTTAPAHPGPIVHPGAFCSPEGAIGYTSAGTRMRCTLKAGEKQPRWRAA